MISSPSRDAPRIFTGIASTYERAGALLSIGQDARWRRALVAAVRASPDELVLDVATGTGLVARDLRSRYGCPVVGLDRSADMLVAAVARNGHLPLVQGRAEELPFPDDSFDHLTFTYLLRYVDDPAAVMRELARVVRPGGRIAALDFGVPGNRVIRGLWRVYTAVGLPLIGRLISQRWAAVGAFLRGSIERFDSSHPQSEVERYWQEAGLVDVRVERMSFGSGVVMTGTKGGAVRVPAERGGRPRGVGTPDRSLGPAFYALSPGGIRDYWTLLHPPYTVWHLSYVLLGAALAPMPDPRIVGGALLAFFLGVGIAAHSFDELQGRPLNTGLPSGVLVAVGSFALAGAVALGVVAASMIGPWFLALVAVGAALVILYAFEVPLVHSDLGFALSWGAFPVIATAVATGAPPLASVAAAAGASLLSLAQRRLSTPVRRVRRKSIEVRGTVRYRDGGAEEIDAARLIGAPEAALRVLWLAIFAISGGALLARWSGG
ncbi:MAG TPA: class I SAM-dependent methyltransferase [Candidatus Limnocylindria bacterium]|jgi:demethylmenaquinone methyltransferase/2-methoxy-6-polyprenyl-1,4-benzoquinol methylase|nr:class I SAM-dependent methyltransferase [Candidatus Limnocylindria bacterium]